MTKTGLEKEALLRRAGAIITTLGEQGSQVLTREGSLHIPAVQPRKVEDPTGAGDSYRGGLISGLVQAKPRAVRPDGQRLRFLCRRVLRHPGIQVQPRGIQRKVQPVFRIKIHFSFFFLFTA